MHCFSIVYLFFTPVQSLSLSLTLAVWLDRCRCVVYLMYPMWLFLNGTHRLTQMFSMQNGELRISRPEYKMFYAEVKRPKINLHTSCGRQRIAFSEYCMRTGSLAAF